MRERKAQIERKRSARGGVARSEGERQRRKRMPLFTLWGLCLRLVQKV